MSEQPPDVVDEVCAVLRVLSGDGKRKGNHRYKKLTDEEILIPALGHVISYMRGERVDVDSGENPLAHACARMLLVMKKEKERVEQEHS